MSRHIANRTASLALNQGAEGTVLHVPTTRVFALAAMAQRSIADVIE